VSNNVRWLHELSLHDLAQVRGKNASLGEMIRNVATAGVRVPGGVATTADAYRAFLAQDELGNRIQAELAVLDVNDVNRLAETGARIRGWVLAQPLQPELEQEIERAFRELEREYGTDVSWAARSSATAEDLPDASFAGQQETFLNVSGLIRIKQAVHEVFASLFNDRAIAYRVHQGFEHGKVALSAGIQKMVRSDLGASGVAFTLDTESGFRDVVFITANYGLGERVVQGAVNPDEFYVHKPTLAAGRPAILRRNLGGKAVEMVYAGSGDNDRPVRVVEVAADRQRRFSLTDPEVEALARQAVLIEQHYGRPMDIEWGRDGLDGEIYILQARPETVQSRSGRVVERYRLQERGNILAEGRSIGHRIGAGSAKVITSLKEMDQVQPGDVLVTDMTDPDWEPIMKRAAAFAPHPVIVRMSDFKSNEYANLLGGKQYEPEEANPMIGFRGASRYVADSFRACWEMECAALKRVRDDMGLTNVEIMIPFVRTLEEAKAVVDALAENGLKRGENGLRLIMMCEIPSNALLADQFLDNFDGFSIGSNDMTQLTLGLDRDSSLIAKSFDERNPAVKKLLSMSINACRKQGKYIGICGQGPSDHPDLAKWLVEQGIGSLPLNPDTVIDTRLFLAG
jgi:phosphoenolpyruvate synthase/pyruvate phosphate dikinase